MRYTLTVVGLFRHVASGEFEEAVDMVCAAAGSLPAGSWAIMRKSVPPYGIVFCFAKRIFSFAGADDKIDLR